MTKNPIHSTAIVLAGLALILASLACGRQGGTEATQTPIILVATATPPGTTGVATTVPEPTSTPVPGGCADGMQFVADVSVPDGTVFGPGEHFIKTWRIRNSGSCDWSAYHVVFADGEPMGTLDQAIPDTPAGEELDISIEMTAPGGAGNYTGRWRVQSPDGATLGNLTCVIVVQGGGGAPPPVEPTQPPQPTQPGATSAPPANLRLSGWGMHSLTFAWDDAVGEADYLLMLGSDSVPLGTDTASYVWENPPCGQTVAVTLIARAAGGAEIGRVTLSDVNTPACPQAQTVTLQSLPAEDGYVRGVTGGESVALNGEVNVGDGTQNRAQQAFFSFDISGIPAGAIIQSATLDLSNHTVRGNPFERLGALAAYYVQYGELDVGDYVAGWPHGRITLSGPPTVLNPAHDLQLLVNARAPRFQIRLQFEAITDNDSHADELVFPEGGPALTVTYYVP
jgi:hypothetical protein